MPAVCVSVASLQLRPIQCTKAPVMRLHLQLFHFFKLTYNCHITYKFKVYNVLVHLYIAMQLLKQHQLSYFSCNISFLCVQIQSVSNFEICKTVLLTVITALDLHSLFTSCNLVPVNVFLISPLLSPILISVFTSSVFLRFYM